MNFFKRLVAKEDSVKLQSAAPTDNNATSPNSDNATDNDDNSVPNGSNKSPLTPSSAASLAANATTRLSNGMHIISQSLQKKFSRGVHYNMKIVIRGDCNVGKTCLFLRLQGQSFKEVYEMSDEIKVANIQWNYKTTDDIVKVEVWDVVDRSKAKRAQTEHRLVHSNILQDKKKLKAVEKELANMVQPALDAEFIDVYKNTNGVIMVYDMTKQWTWDYVERELPKVPQHIPVLVVGNHRDMHHHRNVDQLKCKFFIESLDRGNLGSAVRYSETSMRTGFGLKYIHKFFNIPFLQLQRENLMQQLETNAKEMDSICEELQGLEESVERDYDDFSDQLNNKRRQQQEANAKDVLKNAKSVDEARRLAAERDAAAAAKAADNASEPQKVLNNILNTINTKVLPEQPPTAQQSMSVTIDPATAKNALAATAAIKTGGGSSASLAKNKIVVEDDEFNRFLDDPVFKAPPGSLVAKPANKATTAVNAAADEDDEDDDATPNGNPMVAAYKETLDSSDEEQATTKKTAKENEVKSSSSSNFLQITAGRQHSNSMSSQSSSVSVGAGVKKTQLTPSATSASLSQNNEEEGEDDVKEDSNNGHGEETTPTPPQFNLTHDDFEFLEKMSAQLSKNTSLTAEKKITKVTDDDSSKSSKKKTAKSKKNDSTMMEKAAKSKKSKSKKNIPNGEEEGGEDDNKIVIKKDVDYEDF